MMMNNRSRQRGENHHHHNNHHNYQQVQGPRSQHRKPPHGTWQPTVPSWEKRFCYTVGLVPWRKLMETKKFMYLYENVVQWSDSAVEEAFHNAKNRFWAEINGLPCNISLPDPDIYIDEVDWNSDVDPELLLDLEREPKDPDVRGEGEEVVILGATLTLNQTFACTGWGESEEGLQKADNEVLDPGWEVGNQNTGDNNNLSEIDGAHANGTTKDNGWGDSWENNYNGWDDNYSKCYNENDRIGETWGGDIRESDDSGWYMSRYKTSRYHGDDYQTDRGWWRNGRGRKRVNFAY